MRNRLSSHDVGRDNPQLRRGGAPIAGHPVTVCPAEVPLTVVYAKSRMRRDNIAAADCFSGVRPKHISALLLGAASVLALAPSAAMAQAVPGSLPSREQVLPPVPRTAPAPSDVRVDGTKAFRETACPFEQSAERVTIGSVRFVRPDGAPLPGELVSLLADIAPAQGEQSIAQVCALRDEANRILQRAGYVASVQIPAQQIDNGGGLVLSVVTAKLVDIKVEGESKRYSRLIAARAEQLKGIDPFNERAAERILLLAGDVPGLDVELSLAPAGTVPGEVVGTLTVAYRPFAVVGNVQNFGSRSLGRETAYLRVEGYGLTGLADVTYVGASTTRDFREQRVLQVGHGFGLGDHGHRMEASVTSAWSRPDVGGLDLRSRSLVATIAMTTPLIRTLDRNLTLSGGLDAIDQRTKVWFGSPVPLTRDTLRVAFARLSGGVTHSSQEGANYALSGGLELRRGLDIFGATKQGEITSEGYAPSSFFGDPTATLARVDLDGQIAVDPVFSIAATVRAQVANSPLMNYEKFSIGSLTIGRGYDPGAASGDNALGGRFELRGQAYRGRTAAAELFGFFDHAWLWNHARYSKGATPQLLTEPDRALSSFGAGVRLSLPANMLLEASYARPLNRVFEGDTRRPGDRLLLSLTAQFSPR